MPKYVNRRRVRMSVRRRELHEGGRSSPKLSSRLRERTIEAGGEIDIFPVSRFLLSLGVENGKLFSLSAPPWVVRCPKGDRGAIWMTECCLRVPLPMVSLKVT